MLKKVFLLSAIVIISASSLIAQTNTSNGDEATSTNGQNSQSQQLTLSQLNENFIDVLSNQSEDVLKVALEGGDARVKGIVLKVLAQKATDDPDVIKIINQYIPYGISQPTAQNYASVRYNAIEAAALVKNATSVPILASLLYSENYIPNILMTIYALGEIKDSRAVPAIITRLKLSQNHAIVFEGVIALGKIGDPSSLSTLLDISQNSQYNLALRNQAINSIKELKISSSDSNNDDNSTSSTANTNSTNAE